MAASTARRQKGGVSNRGTVFKLDADGTLTTLHSFTDGNGIDAGVIQATDGSFYGTTPDEGTYSRGTVFRLDAHGTLTTLYSFTGDFIGDHDGNGPSGLIQGTDGMFYGTTSRGGSNDKGTIFKIDAAGTCTKLHNFGGKKGQYPYAGVIQGSDGSFYGTTREGGEFGRGTVFKFEPGTLTILHSFSSDENAFPETAVTQGVDGSFYGTTSYLGTVFKLDAAGTLTTFHTFTAGDGGAASAGVIQASDGNFYGTTGSTIFKLDPVGTLTTLYSFTGVSSAGKNPYAGVIQVADGSFYGTTAGGGAFGRGTVFKLDTAGTLTTFHSFTGGSSEGANPYAGVIQATDGSFYGTTTAWRRVQQRHALQARCGGHADDAP